MKYIIEMINPEYFEIEAKTAQEALETVKRSIQDPRIRDYIELKVVQEMHQNE